MSVISEIATARYITDAAASRFQIKAFVAGVLSALGHNPTIAIRDFAGEVRFQPGTLEVASLELRLKASSFEVTNQIRDKDKREIEENMHRDVLETDQFPEIVFQSSAASAVKTGEGQFRIDLNGSLTLHGVTRSQPISDIRDRERRIVTRARRFLDTAVRLSNPSGIRGWWYVEAERRAEVLVRDRGAAEDGNNLSMCLAIPGQIVEITPGDEHSAIVDIVGVRRRVDIRLVEDEFTAPGDWVLSMSVSP